MGIPRKTWPTPPTDEKGIVDWARRVYVALNEYSTSLSGAAVGGTDHALLTNLTYATAGHTGFEPTITAGTSAQYFKGDKSLATFSTGVTNLAWPVGCVFLSFVSTNPATLLGIGTWAAIGTGRVLVGYDSGDADFNVAEKTGGSKTSTPDAHAGAAVGNHSAHTHGYGTIATDGHGSFSKSVSGSGTTILYGPTGAHTISGSTGDPSATLSHSVTQPSAHGAMSIMPPYVVVYMWKRTA